MIKLFSFQLIWMIVNAVLFYLSYQKYCAGIKYFYLRKMLGVRNLLFDLVSPSFFCNISSEIISHLFQEDHPYFTPLNQFSASCLIDKCFFS